nr:unnamed protein product [Spirometra erinaceieuropaei]
MRKITTLPLWGLVFRTTFANCGDSHMEVEQTPGECASPDCSQSAESSPEDDQTTFANCGDSHMEAEQTPGECASPDCSQSAESSPEDDQASDAVDLKQSPLVEDRSSEADEYDHSSSYSGRELGLKPSPQQFVPPSSSLADQSRTQTRKKGTERGGFRLSEPFTLVMRMQADALVKTVSQADADAFRTQVWNLWTNYLAITGEFGPKAWARAFQRVAKSLGKEHTRYLLTPTGGRHKPAERTLVCGTRRAHELILAALPLAGWGQFCDFLGEISSGSEVSGSHPFRFQSTVEQDDEETVLVARDKVTGEEVSVVEGTEAEEEEDEEEDLDEEGTREKRKEGQSTEEDVESTGYIESSQLETNPEEKYWSRLSQKQKEFVEYFENTASLGDVEDLWMDFLLDLMSSEESPSAKVFWRGRTQANARRCQLMEFNLAILFLSAMLSFATERRKDRSTCNRGYLTISALHRLCQDKDFPYLTAATALNSSPFAFLDFSLFQLFRRSRPPKPSLMASITLRLADMLAISHRPLLPLSWLVHQWLLTLGLPREAHRIATRLISRLGAVVRRAAPARDDKDLLLFLPNLRYLRGEVFAAAVAVVVARLLFKLDDSFEYRWSNVATFLSHCLRLNNAFFSSTAAAYRRGKRAPRHFVWAEWAAWLEARSSSNQSGSAVAAATSSRTDLEAAASTSTTAGDPPLQTAVQVNDLLPIDSATQFLGPAEFDPSQDVGWFERSDCGRAVSQPEMKSSLSQPLRDLTGSPPSATARKSLAAVNDSPAPSPSHIPPCKLCSRYSRDSAIDADTFKHPPAISLSSCHLLLGVKQATAEETPSARTFLHGLFKEAGVQKKSMFQDWMYIVKRSSSYDPISDLHFPGRQNRRLLKDEHSLPVQVKRLLAEHSARVEHLLSVEEEEEEEDQSEAGIEPGLEGEEEEGYQSPTATEPNQQKSKLAEPSASLSWFLETVCLLAGVRLPDLLLEVFLVEGILLREEFGIPSRHASHITNLALAAAFDYSVT